MHTVATGLLLNDVGSTTETKVGKITRIQKSDVRIITEQHEFVYIHSRGADIARSLKLVAVSRHVAQWCNMCDVRVRGVNHQTME